MNGLKYIRMRCNISINELAAHIGVSRQAIIMWEQEKKKIPPKRLKQLSDFFGVEQTYFGDITDVDKVYLCEKAMFRFDENGKESYRYKPQEESKFCKDLAVYFYGACDMSLDDEHMLAQKRKNDLLREIDEIITGEYEITHLRSHANTIEYICGIYSMINQLLKAGKNQKLIHRAYYRKELVNIWKAMMIAFELMEIPENAEFVKKDDATNHNLTEDVEWIRYLSQEIKKHWDKDVNRREEFYEELRKTSKDKYGSPIKDEKLLEEFTINEKIAYVENFHKENLKKRSIDMNNTKGPFIYHMKM